MLILLIYILPAIFLAGGIYSALEVYKSNSKSSNKSSWLLTNAGLVVLIIILVSIVAWVINILDALERLGLIFAMFMSAGFIMLQAPLIAHHIMRPFFSDSGMGRELKDDPTDPMGFAQAAEDRGEISSAIERYRRILKDTPHFTEARIRAAILMAKGAKHNAAISLIEEGLSLEELNEQDSITLSSLLKDITDPAQAKFDIQKDEVDTIQLIGLEERNYARSTAIATEEVDTEPEIEFNDTNEAAADDDDSSQEDFEAPIKI